jgi:hypothetical protein
MNRILLFASLGLCLAAPAWAAGDADLLRQAGQASQTGGGAVMRDASGRRTGTVEQQGDARVIRDAGGRRVGTMERSGSDWTVRDETGRRVGTIDNR